MWNLCRCGRQAADRNSEAIVSNVGAKPIKGSSRDVNPGWQEIKENCVVDNVGLES